MGRGRQCLKRTDERLALLESEQHHLEARRHDLQEIIEMLEGAPELRSDAVARLGAYRRSLESATFECRQIATWEIATLRRELSAA